MRPPRRVSLPHQLQFNYNSKLHLNQTQIPGKMHGRGQYRYAEGDIYSGEWREDKRHGKGTVEYVSNQVSLIEVDGEYIFMLASNGWSLVGVDVYVNLLLRLRGFIIIVHNFKFNLQSPNLSTHPLPPTPGLHR